MKKTKDISDLIIFTTFPTEIEAVCVSCFPLSPENLKRVRKAFGIKSSHCFFDTEPELMRILLEVGSKKSKKVLEHSCHLLEHNFIFFVKHGRLPLHNEKQYNYFGIGYRVVKVWRGAPNVISWVAIERYEHSMPNFVVKANPILLEKFIRARDGRDVSEIDISIQDAIDVYNILLKYVPGNHAIAKLDGFTPDSLNSFLNAAGEIEGSFKIVPGYPGKAHISSRLSLSMKTPRIKPIG